VLLFLRWARWAWRRSRLDILAKLDGCILLLIAVAAARTGAPDASEPLSSA
jgi:hypothetical protein